MPKKKISITQLEEYILKLQEYIDGLRNTVANFDSGNPPTMPPKPPILK